MTVIDGVILGVVGFLLSVVVGWVIGRVSAQSPVDLTACNFCPTCGTPVDRTTS